MKIIYNKFIPTKKFKALTLFNLIFVRNGNTLSEEDKNYQRIYIYQQYECLAIGIALIKLLSWIFTFSNLYILFAPLTYFILYAINWIVNLFLDIKSARMNIVFVKEAENNYKNPSYPNTRMIFSWLKLLKKK